MRGDIAAGPFVPTAQRSMRYAMAGDDCSLHFELEARTPRQQADHRSNQVLTAMLQVALLYIGKAHDEVCLYDEFRAAPWAQALARYRGMFADLGLEPVQESRLRFHPLETFYESVAATPRQAELDNLYMVSGSNMPVHGDPEALEVSRALNSKVHFAEHAPAFGLPVPPTLHVRKRELGGAEVADFFADHGAPLMCKTLGLAGARNVTSVASVEAAGAYLCEYHDDMDVLLQHRLSAEDYTEMTVDLVVAEDRIAVTNVRRILFADGLWVGNQLGAGVGLGAEQERVLLRVGEYARSHGFSSPHGLNLGIDYFERNPAADPALPELLVTEINARWTGGLFPAELVRRLGVADREVVAFIDLCPPDRLGDYLAFLERHLHGRADGDFAAAPMGFAPYPSEVDGREQLFVWQIVIGDFEAFKQARARELGDDVLVTAPAITAAM